MQRNVVITDIASYTRFKTELVKKERELERPTTDVEKMKKQFLVAKMGDYLADTVFIAYLTEARKVEGNIYRSFLNSYAYMLMRHMASFYFNPFPDPDPDPHRSRPQMIWTTVCLSHRRFRFRPSQCLW